MSLFAFHKKYSKSRSKYNRKLKISAEILAVPRQTLSFPAPPTLISRFRLPPPPTTRNGFLAQ